MRLTFALFFFSRGDGFTPMGIYDGTWGLVLLAAYLPVVRGATSRRTDRASTDGSFAG